MLFAEFGIRFPNRMSMIVYLAGKPQCIIHALQTSFTNGLVVKFLKSFAAFKKPLSTVFLCPMHEPRFLPLYYRLAERPIHVKDNSLEHVSLRKILLVHRRNN